MSKLEDARDILLSIGMPKKQQNDMCCYCLLALLQMTEYDEWTEATNNWFRIHDIMGFIKRSYGVEYAENSRETIRKVALHNFRNAALIEDNGKVTNSPLYRYRVKHEALQLIQAYKSDRWGSLLDNYNSIHPSLVDIYASKKKVSKKPVLIHDYIYYLSAGSHNELQRAIIEEFAPRFAEKSICLYLGDSTNRDLYKDEDLLSYIGFDITLHDKMPDVVLYRADNNWLYFIEAVTSVGPMSAKRVLEIEEMTKYVSSGKIFITAFPDFKTYKRFSAELAWETEVWISEMPDHMIHLNGHKFLGPR